MIQSPVWLPIFKKTWRHNDPKRLLSVVKELAVRAERRLLFFRLMVVAVNSSVFYLSLQQMVSMPLLALVTLLTSWVYGLGLLFMQPYFSKKKHNRIDWLVPLCDGVLLTFWVTATGGFNSPFYIMYYLGIVGVAFRFSTYLVYAVSVLFLVLYAGTCIYLGDYAVWELVFRCAVMVMAAAVGELIVSESVAQAVSREKYREGLQESERMQAIFRDVQKNLELAVNNRTRELAHANSSLELEVSKRRDIENALIKSIEETNSANRAKSEFLANISHEIRTPLNAVMGYSELLAENYACQNERQLYADVVRKNGALLGAIIGDILDLSKIENGSIQLDLEPLDVRAVVDDVGDLFRREAENKGLKFEVDVGESVPDTLVADLTRLKQILVNLVGNAIKFSESGSVTVRAELAEHRELGEVVRFIVKDSGIGISDDERRRIFTPFTQADSSISKKYGGTGLGLAISRKLAHKMNGLLELGESGKGKGASFILTLATSPEPGEGKTTKSEKMTEKKTKKALDELRFLVVDDAPDNQVLLQHLLNNFGAKTIELAVDGVEAIRLGSSHDYDVILMDLQMPRVDGFQATNALRRLGISVPIIAVTAHALTEVRDRALSEGFSGFIAKPVMPGKLISVILDVLKRSPKSLAIPSASEVNCQN